MSDQNYKQVNNLDCRLVYNSELEQTQGEGVKKKWQSVPSTRGVNDQGR